MEMFKERLQLLLDEKDINQKELAEMAGVTEVTISRYVNGTRKPRIEIVNKIAEVLNTTTDYLLGNSDIKNPYKQEELKKEFKEEIEALDKFRQMMVSKGFDYKDKTYEELAQIIVKHIKIQDLLNDNDSKSN